MTARQRSYLCLLLVSLLAGCASLPEQAEHSQLPVIAKPDSTLSQLVNSTRPTDAAANISAFQLQESGWDALSQRLALIESAEYSIDVQYYIWNSDKSGGYLASRLIAAADRGVKVRVLLDDFNLDHRDDLIAMLDRNPNIEIRIFNPVPSRNGVAKWLNLASDFSRLNRRMHNKSFTVDGAVSIIGGRNIGDEYFDLSDEINFHDRDVLVGGAVVDDIQTSFLTYWHSTWSYPINLLAKNPSADVTMLKAIPAPEYKNYPSLPVGKKSSKQLLTTLMQQWSWGDAYFVFDNPVPEDITETDQPKATARLLATLFAQADQEILIESAYLIFDDRQLAALQSLADKKQVSIKALTNSMASNDVLANHSGYAGRRLDMLNHGIELFELKPTTNLCETSTKDATKCAPTARYGLHAKSAVYDNRIASIGSFNFNLRSTYLNTESVLIIKNEKVAQHLAGKIKQAMREENSWRLSVEEGNVRWHSGQKVWDKEPETGQWERIESHFLQLLPVEKYL